MKLNISLLLSAATLFNAATAIDTVNLRSAANYAILTESGISSVPASDITGDIAVSPIAATAITGFSLTKKAGENWSTTTQLTGKAWAPDYHADVKTMLTTAVSDMHTAYNDAAGRERSEDEDKIALELVSAGDISGETLTPGVYTFTSTISINADITLQGTNSDSDIFIIRTTGSLLQAASTNVILDDVSPANVFWQVAGQVDIGASAVMNGVLLTMKNVKFNVNSSLNGRVLAQTACDLDHATIKSTAVPQSSRAVVADDYTGGEYNDDNNIGSSSMCATLHTAAIALALLLSFLAV